jgi:hypothetical protein
MWWIQRQWSGGVGMRWDWGGVGRGCTDRRQDIRITEPQNHRINEWRSTALTGFPIVAPAHPRRAPMYTFDVTRAARSARCVRCLCVDPAVDSTPDCALLTQASVGISDGRPQTDGLDRTGAEHIPSTADQTCLGDPLVLVLILFRLVYPRTRNRAAETRRNVPGEEAASRKRERGVSKYRGVGVCL